MSQRETAARPRGNTKTPSTRRPWPTTSCPANPSRWRQTFGHRSAAITKKTRRPACWRTGVSWTPCMPSICRTPLQRQPADHLSQCGVVEGNDRRPQGTIRLEGHADPRSRREEDRGGPEVADATGVRRHAPDRRGRLPEGLPPDRDPNGQEGHGRGRHRHRLPSDQEPQGRFLEVGLAADAPRTGPDLRHPG